MINDLISIESGEGENILALNVRIGEVKHKYFPNTDLTENTELVIPMDGADLFRFVEELINEVEFYNRKQYNHG